MTGTEGDPFDNLFDAIERAYELAADSSEATITIKILAGEHFLKREKREFRYKPVKIDRQS